MRHIDDDPSNPLDVRCHNPSITAILAYPHHCHRHHDLLHLACLLLRLAGLDVDERLIFQIIEAAASKGEWRTFIAR